MSTVRRKSPLLGARKATRPRKPVEVEPPVVSTTTALTTVEPGWLFIPEAFLDAKLQYLQSNAPLFLTVQGERCPGGVRVPERGFKLRTVTSR